MKSRFLFLFLRQTLFHLFCIKPFFWLFFNFKMSGKDEIKNLRGPLIIISNHKNMLDSFAIAAVLPLFSSLFPIRIMGEIEHFESGILNVFLRFKIIKLVYWYFGVFPAIRGIGIEKSLEIPVKILKNNEGNILMHPEGKVVKEYNIEEFKRGAAALARMTNFPVLPAALRIIKKSDSLRPFYALNFGLPICLPQNISPEEGSEILRRLVIKLYQEIK